MLFSDLSCRSRLATLNEKLTSLERQVEYIEARVSIPSYYEAKPAIAYSIGVIWCLLHSSTGEKGERVNHIQLLQFFYRCDSN